MGNSNSTLRSGRRGGNRRQHRRQNQWLGGEKDTQESVASEKPGEESVLKGGDDGL